MYRIILIFLLTLLAGQACFSGDFQGYSALSTSDAGAHITAIPSEILINSSSAMPVEALGTLEFAGAPPSSI